MVFISKIRQYAIDFSFPKVKYTYFRIDFGDGIKKAPFFSSRDRYLKSYKMIRIGCTTSSCTVWLKPIALRCQGCIYCNCTNMELNHDFLK